jgi:hypothetical protein
MQHPMSSARISRPAASEATTVHRLIEDDWFQDRLNIEWGETPARQSRVALEPV